MAGQALAAPSWQSLPEELLSQPGTWQDNIYAYAVGSAEIQVYAGRAGKAEELARKKSLAHTLARFRFSLNCPAIEKNLHNMKGEQLSLLLAPATPELTLSGLSLLRQWRQKNTMFTLARVPRAQLPTGNCPFVDLDQALAVYSHSSEATTTGLNLCFNYARPYTALAKKLGDRLTNHLFGSTPNYNQLLQQNRFHRASLLIAEASSKQPENPEARLANIKKALNLSPFHPQANLQLAGYYREIDQRHGLARLTARRAMADGTGLEQGLVEMAEICKATGSAEEGIWRYLSQQSGTEGQPQEWQAESELLQQAPITSLVIMSGGQAISGESMAPAPPFQQAVQLYQQSSSDDDLLKVLALLVESAEKEPKATQTWNLIGACYRNLGRPLMALPFFWQAVNLQPDFDLALTNLALCSQSLGLAKASSYYLDHPAVQNSSNPWVASIRQKQVQ